VRQPDQDPGLSGAPARRWLSFEAAVFTRCKDEVGINFLFAIDQSKLSHLRAGIALAIITAVQGVGTKLSGRFATISTSLE
jgi:hypothetical protein